MGSILSIDIIALIALCITVFLALHNKAFTKYKKSAYLMASFSTALLLILEATTFALGKVCGSTAVLWNKLFNAMGFAFCPLALYVFFISYFGPRSKHKLFLSLPLALCIITSCASVYTGWVYTVSADNVYSRGPVFFIPSCVALFYFFLLLHFVATNRCDYERDEYIYFGIITAIIGSSVVLQLVFPQLRIIWGSVAISLMLFYVMQREQQFKYDVLAGVKTRDCFEKQLVELGKEQLVSVIVMDINNFKYINDTYGHAIGDRAIKLTAHTVERCFRSVGTTFRIGGDEFCVLSSNIGTLTTEQYIKATKDAIAERCEAEIFDISVACGYAVFRGEGTIYDTFKEADGNMYKDKVMQKADLS